MNSFALADADGIVGAVLMDIAEALAAQVGLRSGVSVALVGRWALGLLHGQWAHADIARPPARPGKVWMGWALHFLFGGGGVALLSAAFAHAAGFGVPVHHLWGGVVFGAITSLLLWLALLPAFGWDRFGRRGPQGASGFALRRTRSRVGLAG